MENPCFKEKVLVYFHTFELTLLESRGIYNFRIIFKNNRHKYIGTHYRFLRLFLWVPSKSIVLVLLSLYPLTKIWWYQILRIDYHFIQKFVSILRIELQCIQRMGFAVFGWHSSRRLYLYLRRTAVDRAGSQHSKYSMAVLKKAYKTLTIINESQACHHYQ